MHLEQTSIRGCFEISPQIKQDMRGHFVKTFHFDWFKNNGLVTNFAEEYYSVSHKGVLRGMHFQTPPHDHFKLVSCLSGRVLDAIVDLRIGSPTYGEFATSLLTSEHANMLYIAPGIAHGFYALTEGAVVQYKVTSVYQPNYDGGIKWDSIGISWPDSSTIISDRDNNFPSLADFQSPFSYSS